MSNAAGSTVVRGCLSGSNGNYMVMDSQTHTMYMLSGSTGDLSSRVGHEVQITGALNGASNSTTSSNPNSATTTNPNSGNSNAQNPSSASPGTNPSDATQGAAGAGSNTLQVNNVTEVSSTCAGSTGSSTGPSAAASDTTGSSASSTMSATSMSNQSAPTAAAGAAAVTATDAAANSSATTSATTGAAASETSAGASNYNSSPAAAGTTVAQGSTPDASGAAAGTTASQDNSNVKTYSDMPSDQSAAQSANAAPALRENSQSLPATSTVLPLGGLLGLGFMAAGLYARR